LKLHAYKIQLKQEITPDDRPKRVEFATFMLNAIDEDETFLRRICFLDEATFYVKGCVNRHICRIWGTQQLNEIHEYVLWETQRVTAQILKDVDNDDDDVVYLTTVGYTMED
jgi:hypothetical protein